MIFKFKILFMIIVRAPFRIPLGGGGTDLPSYYSKFGGSLFSAAINRYMFVSVNRPLVDKLIRVKYTETEIVDNVDQVKHNLVREALRQTGFTDSIEINSIADLSAGSGMGSSGSYLVGLLKALHTLKRENLSTQALAEEACKIEIEILKKPIGKQDQYLAAFGGITKLEIDKKGLVKVSPVPLSLAALRELENSMLVFYTGIRREGREILTKQNKATKQNDQGVINNLHLIKQIGFKIEKALIRGDLVSFGKLLHQHWMSKQKLSKSVSSTKINRLYKMGIKAGCLGGKIMGAGGGGFLMFCCPGDKTKVRKAMSDQGLPELFFHFDLDGAKVLVDI